MPRVDLVIRNGEVVTEHGSEGVKSLGITGEVITHLGGNLEGSEEIDAFRPEGRHETTDHLRQLRISLQHFSVQGSHVHPSPQQMCQRTV